MAKVELINIHKTYENSFKAVDNANFTVEDKEFVILVGPSGCGKTTTLRMIAGLESISDGQIIIDGKVINDVAPKDRDIAMVFQNYALYPHMTVYQNMAFALKLRKYSKKDIDKKIQETAQLLDIKSLLDRKPKQLSGGQRQRVALGRAIVRRPKVFLFDEPLSNLDAKLRVQMRAEIIKLHQSLQSTMVYVTHDQIEAMTMGDKIVVMKDGVIQQVNTPINVYNQPTNLFVASFIGSPSMNLIEGKLIKENNELIFKTDNFSLKIPTSKRKSIEKYSNGNIILGIRPENVYDSNFAEMAEFPQEINTICEIVEPMGNEFIIYLSKGKSKITARIHPKKLPIVGSEIKVKLDMNYAHFFDIETEIRLT